MISNTRPIIMATGAGLYRPVLLLHLLVTVSYSAADISPSLKDKSCTTCHEIITKFRNGLEKTSKANFGGGNTNWEEKSLGSYKHSETRLVEIVEQLCSKSSKSDDACHRMVEANEETIEDWWREHYVKQSRVDLNQFLCVDHLGVCCANGTYGPTCSECLGGRMKPCGGNGRCVGDGTRAGTGTCTCNTGYGDKLCDVCDQGYYRENGNTDSVVCKKCHESCKSRCNGPGPQGCVDCAEGYSRTTEGGCVDDDECEDKEICDENEFCTNTPGSFRCARCNSACNSCVGPGEGNCTECAAKHFTDAKSCRPCHRSCMSSCTDALSSSCDACAEGWATGDGGSSECVDVDECFVGSVTCASDEYCVNTEGSYTCATCHSSCHACTGPGNEGCTQCKEGYARRERKCVDVDECIAGSQGSPGEAGQKCTGPHGVCVNTLGSYRCDCEKNYVMSPSGECVLKSKQAPPKVNPATAAKPTPKTKTSRTKIRQQWFELVLYVCALMVFVAIGSVLQRRLYCQAFMTLVFGVYLYWFALYLEKLALKQK